MEKKRILLAQAGDADAYANVFSVYEVELYKLAYVHIGNREDALDIVQETAYRSFKYIHSLKQPEYYKTWLIRILINVANNLLKKRNTYEELDEEIATDDASLEIDVQVMLNGIMEHLNTQEKQVIYLKYYEDLTIQQIADLLEYKLGSTKTILYRALSKLKSALEQEDPDAFKGRA